MKTYIKPVSKVVLLGTVSNFLDGAPLGLASIHDTDTGKTEWKDINGGNPDPNNDPSSWGGDAKGSSWSSWDDDED